MDDTNVRIGKVDFASLAQIQKGSRSAMSVGRTTNNKMALVHIQKE